MAGRQRRGLRGMTGLTGLTGDRGVALSLNHHHNSRVSRPVA